MSDERLAPETSGVTVLAAVDLGPEIDGMAGRQLRMRMVTIVVTLACIAIAVIAIVFVYAAFINEKKYLTIIQRDSRQTEHGGYEEIRDERP